MLTSINLLCEYQTAWVNRQTSTKKVQIDLKKIGSYQVRDIVALALNASLTFKTNKNDKLVCLRIDYSIQMFVISSKKNLGYRLIFLYSSPSSIAEDPLQQTQPNIGSWSTRMYRICGYEPGIVKILIAESSRRIGKMRLDWKYLRIEP